MKTLLEACKVAIDALGCDRTRQDRLEAQEIINAAITKAKAKAEYYVVTFYKDGHYDVLIAKAESHFDATRKGEEEVTRWPGHKLHGVIWVNKKAIERGDLVHLYSV